MPASKMYYGNVKTSEDRYRKVIVTAVRMKNDVNGNPRHAVQVWAQHIDHLGHEIGNLWHPPVKGFTLTKSDYYIIKETYDLDSDITNFIIKFERAIQL